MNASSVVCPLALVGQWVKEVENITVGFTVKTHHGTNRSSGKLRSVELTFMLKPS